MIYLLRKVLPLIGLYSGRKAPISFFAFLLEKQIGYGLLAIEDCLGGGGGGIQGNKVENYTSSAHVNGNSAQNRRNLDQQFFL
jgi:hypothetical protein